MRGGFLDVAQQNATAQSRGDKRVPQRVMSDTSGDCGEAGDAATIRPARWRLSTTAQIGLLLPTQEEVLDGIDLPR